MIFCYRNPHLRQPLLTTKRFISLFVYSIKEAIRTEFLEKSPIAKTKDILLAMQITCRLYTLPNAVQMIKMLSRK